MISLCGGVNMKKWKALTAIVCAAFLCVSLFNVGAERVHAQGLITISKVYTDKARYNPGDTAQITTDTLNTGDTSWSGTLYLQISYNETSVYSASQSITIPSGQDTTFNFSWTTPTNDFQGYLVKISTSDGESKTSAIDVSSNWTKFPRYGYIANYSSSISQSTIQKQIDALTQDYHIDALQFYDWMWRHEVPIERTDGTTDSEWTDLFGNVISVNTIQAYINALHEENGAAMAYMMSYAAREGYTDYGVDPQWGLFQDTAHQNQLNVDFNNGKYLWLFAPSNANWQNYIANAYKDSINTMGFDGIQMDQMGERDNVFDYSGNAYDLADSFSSLINNVKNQLVSDNANKNFLTFNIVDGTVNGWALNDISKNALTDFGFSEIWWKADNYNDIRNYVEQLRSNSQKKAAVLAAYMNYKDNSGTCYEAENAAYSGADVATNHPGYTGTGFLENFAQPGDYAQFSVTANESMTYPLVFQYGDNSDNATRTVYVDGQNIGTVQFHPQGTWDKFVFDAYIDTYLTAGTHTIKIEYDSADTGAINLDSMTLGEFDDNSVRLADATFAASGASHIELGVGLDDVTMLPNEYYPNTSKAMSGNLKSWMKEYYNFITAYENLLYDPSINYSDQGNQYISINNQTISGNGSSGSIWHITRMTENYDILNLINLLSETDTQWRNVTETPTIQTNLSVKYYLSPDASVSGVYVASPDSNDGISQFLSYSTGTDSTGHYVAFTVPSLDYWDMIYIKRSISVPSNNVYEAENAIKTNVTTNTNHTGYTGTGFVDGFAEQGDEITFQVNATSAGTHALSFRYANDTGYTSTRHIYVDGQYVGTLDMPNLGSWDTWSTASLSTNLTSGIHTVCIYYDSSDDHAINLDNLMVG